MDPAVPPWPDLSGRLTLRTSDVHADFFTRNQVAVLVEQDLRPQGPMRAGLVPLPRAVLDDPAFDLGELLRASLDHVFRPWRFPDPDPFPKPMTVLFPRLTAWWRARHA